MHSARVLVVEDEALVAAALDSCLRVSGAPGGRLDGTRRGCRAQSGRPGPRFDFDGYPPARHPGRMEEGHRINQCLKIPIVYLTAHCDEQTLLRARVTEPYGFVLKPFDEAVAQVGDRSAPCTGRQCRGRCAAAGPAWPRHPGRHRRGGPGHGPQGGICIYN